MRGSGDFSAHDGVVRQQGARAVTPLKECSIYQRFEHGTHLAAALERAVQGGFGAVASAYHCQQGNVMLNFYMFRVYGLAEFCQQGVFLALQAVCVHNHTHLPEVFWLSGP